VRLGAAGGWDYSFGFIIFVAVDFWAIIGIISSVLGIFSFLKNDVISILSLFKKNLLGCDLLYNSQQQILIKKNPFCIFLDTNSP